MKRIFQIALGIIAAIGGYLDIGDLVFNAQAGALFGYKLLWTIPIGVLGIMVFAEQSGRVAAIAKKANFDLIREEYPKRLATLTLAASLGVTVLTLAAELGGMGFALNYFFDVSESFFILVGLLFLILVSWYFSFDMIERLFGYGGLALLVFVVGDFHMHPHWPSIGQGFVPHGSSQLLYWYFAVGLVAAAMMPYEIYFYSSGALEEGWGEKDLGVNRANAIIGYLLGGTLAIGLMVAAAMVLLPQNIQPDNLGQVVLAAIEPFGGWGLVLALLGMFFAIGGATIDTAFSAAYNLSQHQGWKWGKKATKAQAKKWWMVLFAAFGIGFAIVATGVDPVELTEYSVIFSVVAMPLTFFPIVRAASSRELMGKYASGWVSKSLGWLYFGIICILAIAAPVLLVMTNGGGG